MPGPPSAFLVFLNAWQERESAVLFQSGLVTFPKRGFPAALGRVIASGSDESEPRPHIVSASHSTLGIKSARLPPFDSLQCYKPRSQLMPFQNMS